MDYIANTKKNPMYRYLMVLTISSTAGLQAWQTLFNNFAVDVAGLNGNHVGMIQSIREIPGFLALLVVYVIMFIKEYRLSALSILILGFGVAMTGFFPSYIGLILTTLIMSFGFHYYETTNMSLTLQYFDEATSPWVFGKQRSYAAASSIAVGILIYLLVFLLDFTKIYLLFGSLIIAAAVWGIDSKSFRPNDYSATKKHDCTEKIRAFLLSDVYGRGTAPDFYGICRFINGAKISIFRPGSHDSFCRQ